MTRQFKENEVVVDVFGDYAMFAPPEASAERVSYQVPTPSAMRNVLCSIYCKPVEFYYQITRIDVIEAGTNITIMKNEVKSTVDRKKLLKGKDVSIDINNKTTDGGRGERTQRNYVYLKNVYYRVYAEIVMKEGCEDRINLPSVKHQFMKRVKKGKCFHQPFLGTRECIAYFSKPDWSKSPIKSGCVNLGYMLYDVFDPRNNIPLDTSDKKGKGKTNIMAFLCIMNNGTIMVPSVESEEVLKIV